MTELSTTYLGLRLRSPLVASASPLTGRLETLQELEEAGAAAVVLPSLFEEQVEHELVYVLPDSERPPGGPPYPAELDAYALDPEAYADLVRSAKRALGIPVIASLNGATPGGWTKHAEQLQFAGADAIELNVYAVETDLYTSSAAVEDRLLRLVHSIRHAVTIPVAVKLSPYYTALGHLANQLADTHIDGLVLFNRFLQPDMDLERVSVEPKLTLSGHSDLMLPLRWVAILHGRIPVDLAATSGVRSADDVVKLVLAGANVVMLASELLRSGPGRLTELTDGLAGWLAEHGFASVSAARGALSDIAVPDPHAFERVQYVRALTASLASERHTT